MIAPNNFAIHVTYTCPLACAHCCFSSSPAVKDKLPIETIVRTIEELGDDIEMVAFTGGEPFLLGKDLVKLVKLANDNDYTTRIVTSAYFGKRKEVAEKKLGELKEANLKELSISWDDYHEEFVNFDSVYNVFWAAKKFDISVAVNIVQDKNSFWTRDRVINNLGIEDDALEVIVESNLNLTGRADEELNNSEFIEKRMIGPCPYVITGPTLSAKNKLLACCGVIPETKHLVVDDNYNPENLKKSILEMRKSPLLNWLFLRGPYDLIEFIGEEFGVDIPKRKNIGGNCEACKILFSTPEIEDKIPQAIISKFPQINGELNLLQSLGLLTPKNIQALWSGKTFIH